MRGYKGIVFDFDGVITDSEVSYVESLVSYVDSLGKKGDFKRLSAVIGQKVDDIAVQVIEMYDLDIDVETFNTESMKIFTDNTDIRNFEPMDGIEEFLKENKEDGIKMSIASSSDYDYLYTILDSMKLREYFDFVLSGHHLKRSKPDPLIYNMAAEKMGMDKKDLIIIEDSCHGIEAGKAAGIYTVGFKGSRIVQDTSKADMEVYSFKEINI